MNERLIADFLPGISNVTRYMRVYSVMTWMAWRFDDHFRSKRTGLSVREINKRFSQYRERVELLFTWGNLGRGIGMVGSQRPFPKEGGKHRLAFSEFGASTVSWLDAALYGPSLKVTNGLGFLESRAGSSLGPTESGNRLAAALDSALQKSRYYDQLCDVDDDTGSLKMAQDLGEHWSVLESTKRERVEFSEAFAPSGPKGEQEPDSAARCTAVRLVYAGLDHLGGTGGVQELREAIARGVNKDGNPLAASVDEPSRALWTALQMRQLQRLCHEMLLRWVELALFDPPPGLAGRSIGHLARHCGEIAAKQLGLEKDQPLSDVTAQIVEKIGRRRTPLLAGSTVAAVNPFALTQNLIDSRGSAQEFGQLPGFALYGLAIVAVQSASLVDDEHFVRPCALGHRDRLSVSTLIEIFRSYQSRPIAEFVEMLIESCTIGQHFATAASRLEPGKNKYRFVPAETGLKPLISPRQVQSPGLTPDRLNTAMNLMADCGLLLRTPKPDVFERPV